MRVSRTTWITTAVALVAIVVAMAIGGRSAEPDASLAPPRARVRAEKLELRRLAGQVRAGGFLRARADVTISAERAGRVVAFPAVEGARVEAGAVVARLDDTIARANVARARTVARETRLTPNASAADLARADEQLRLAEHELALRAPVAPVAGVVEVHHVDEGEYVGPGTPLVDVVDADALVLDVDVDAEIVHRLDPEASVPVVVTPLADGAPRAGLITRVASRADMRTRRFRVEVTLPAGAPPLRPGMHAEARFEIPGGPAALYVPKAAVRRVQGEEGVFVAVDGRARWRPVRVADVYEEPALWRIVRGDVAEGDRLVVAGFGGLRDGSPVEVER